MGIIRADEVLARGLVVDVAQERECRSLNKARREVRSLGLPMCI